MTPPKTDEEARIERMEQAGDKMIDALEKLVDLAEPASKTDEVEEMRKKYVSMWDRGEFEWNHHEGDKLGQKPISPERIWQTFIEPALSSLHQAEEERMRAMVEEIKSAGVLIDNPIMGDGLIDGSFYQIYKGDIEAITQRYLGDGKNK